MTNGCLRRQQEEREDRSLQPLAARSQKSKGRLCPESPDDIRTCFERDAHRILYCDAFRRLRHKTQVFFFPRNDHICTRLEHTLYVAAISETVCRCLELNTDLARAIAYGHDIGHPAFGHCGEEVLNLLVKNVSPESRGFQHELHALRVVDRLAVAPGRKSPGLNLTYEVRDGIVSHHGESEEGTITPDWLKEPESLSETVRGETRPATLEACVVRFVDRVAYLGRDFEDAVTAGLVKPADLPSEVGKDLGTTNREIISTLVHALVETNGRSAGEIGVPTAISSAMKKLRDFNYERIYRHDKLGRYSEHASNILGGLFHHFREYLQNRSRDSWSAPPNGALTHQAESVFAKFVCDSEYAADAGPAEVALDFVAGMTDSFAVRCFEELFMPRAIV